MKRKPVLEYPCRWLYKVIGDDREGLQRAAVEIIGRQSCTISLSNSSRTGKYHCLNIEVEVLSEANRNAIYQALKEHPQVKLVL
jgi:putative lipoic acid-binding regulatory protein